MRAMVLHRQGSPLVAEDLPVPVQGPQQLLVRVSACGICRTDLHVVDGDLPEPKLPLVPGHQVVGVVERTGDSVEGFSTGQRIGIPWLGGSCGQCDYCLEGRENLCDRAVYTGYQVDGGFAEYTVANAQFCFPIPDSFTDEHAAPLLCAGLIGYRAYRLVRNASRLGLYGFGAAAHLLIQLATQQGMDVFVFTREGDTAAQAFAREHGACWVGSSSSAPPERLDAAIIFAPDGALIPLALRAVRKGGTVVCAGIHMSDIPRFPYRELWGERRVESVANLTRRDGEEYLPQAASIPVRTTVHSYPLEQVNRALDDLRCGRFTGAAVIRI